jgi:hypothetical protein
MTRKAASTRRSFIRKAGVALSVPLAAATAVVPVHAATDEPLAARLAMLEDIDAIRALNQAFARQVSAGEGGALGIDPAIREVAVDDFGARDVTSVAPDRQTAVRLMYCTVEIETVIGPSCPLVEMAREQGGGFVRRFESGVFQHEYLKRDGMWTRHRITYRSA